MYVCVRACVRECECVQAHLGHVHVWVYSSKYGYFKKKKKHVAFGIPTVQPFDPELGHLVIDMVIKIKSP